MQVMSEQGRQQIYQMLTQPASIFSNQPVIDSFILAAFQQYYLRGLQQVASVTRNSVTPDSMARRDSIVAALSTFLHTELAGMGLTLQNCGPLDHLIFMSQDYIPKHGRSKPASGDLQMAPDTVANCISAFSMGFQQLGRGNVWINGVGNPALAPEVKMWQRRLHT